MHYSFTLYSEEVNYVCSHKCPWVDWWKRGYQSLNILVPWPHQTLTDTPFTRLPGIVSWSPILVLTSPNPTKLPRSDEIGHPQGSMVAIINTISQTTNTASLAMKGLYFICKLIVTSSMCPYASLCCMELALHPTLQSKVRAAKKKTSVQDIYSSCLTRKAFRIAVDSTNTLRCQESDCWVYEPGPAVSTEEQLHPQAFRKLNSPFHDPPRFTCSHTLWSIPAPQRLTKGINEVRWIPSLWVIDFLRFCSVFSDRIEATLSHTQ